jgi:hypothetical protein
MPYHGEITLAVSSRHGTGAGGALVAPGNSELAAGLACANIVEEGENHPNVLDDLAKDANAQGFLGVMSAILASRAACNSTGYLLKTPGTLDATIERANLTASRDICNQCITLIDGLPLTLTKPATLVAFRGVLVAARDGCDAMVTLLYSAGTGGTTLPSP